MFFFFVLFLFHTRVFATAFVRKFPFFVFFVF